MDHKIDEIHEHAQTVDREQHLKPVVVTMAIIAALVALVGLMGHRTHNKELLLQLEANREWGMVISQSIRLNAKELYVDLLTVASQNMQDMEIVEKSQEDYRVAAEKHRLRMERAEELAGQLEHQVEEKRIKANRFNLGEIFLHTGLILTSLTLIIRRRFYWISGVGIAATGVMIAASAFFV